MKATTVGTTKVKKAGSKTAAKGAASFFQAKGVTRRRAIEMAIINDRVLPVDLKNEWLEQYSKVVAKAAKKNTLN